jgi:translation initiation factor eIF-2B subunit alpha/methylthioribose-1-phosphate isomerase
MKIEGNNYKSLWRKKNIVYFIDQRKLPFSFEIFTANSVDNIAFAIKEMVVRGAPAIGAAAVYGMAIGSSHPEETAKILRATRPTAFDLFYAIDYMLKRIAQNDDPYTAADAYIADMINRCRLIGVHGNKLIENNMTLLTHCNAGALATVDYGTALAPMRIAHTDGKSFFVYADETRPRLQGLLTTWELHQEGIDNALIADNAAGYLMKNNDIDFVITGADRVTKNGDIANKIGTYEKAVLAKENGIPFYVAAPKSTFDMCFSSGEKITIEERSPEELKKIFGRTIMPKWLQVRNPAFDVTPSKYISAYITEEGIKTNPLYNDF